MLRKKIALFCPLFLLVAGLLSAPVLAQSTATLQGTVTDSKGAVVPDATVTVRNRSTSFERTTQTDTEGSYQVAALPVGTYSIEVKIQGFKTQVADQVTLEVAKTVVQNFQMDVGAISEQVLVSSDLPELLGMCDRIAIMRQGTITDTVSTTGLSEAELIDHCYGRATTAAA